MIYNPMPVPSTTAVTATSTIGLAVTLTIAAPGAGKRLYLTNLEINKFAGALLVAAATPVVVTTTGISGAPSFAFSAGAEAQGTAVEYNYAFAVPLQASALNTAITIVCPATTSLIWTVNAYYFTA